jgi:hypothetical protein
MYDRMVVDNGQEMLRLRLMRGINGGGELDMTNTLLGCTQAQTRANRRYCLNSVDRPFRG